MKKLLMILALAIAITPCIPTSAMTVVQKNMGYISVNITESSEITPNVANVTFSVETTDIDSKRAVERNNQITDRVIKALKEELASDKCSMVQTKNFNLRPNYKTDKNEETVIKNYTAINSLEVKTTDISKISSLINIAIKNNVSQVRGVNFSIENEDAYATEQTKKAVEKAKALAKNTAIAADQKIVGIKSLRVNTYQQTSNGFRVLKAAGIESAKDTATPIESGKIKLNTSIDAEFYVK